MLLGDVMIGRLIDQLLPTHVHEPSEARAIEGFRSRTTKLLNYDYKSPWGNSIPLLKSSDLVLANLETAMTTHDKKWPNKVFNYRTHPANVQCLIEAGVNYVSLANNHTLDFSEDGLVETVKTLQDRGIAFAGAATSEQDATKPAVLSLGDHQVHCYSFSDHPSDWRSVRSFNLIDYTSKSRASMKRQIEETPKDGLRIVSLHWGPNYRLQPTSELVDLAHFLVDDCGVDIIHGHSSHHVQGVETYKGKLIIYGCGDFVDDYAVDAKYRNDLSAAWKVTVASEAGGSIGIQKLEVFPNRIKQFQANILSKDDVDHEWVRKSFIKLCDAFGTKIQNELGDQGQIVVMVKEP